MQLAAFRLVQREYSTPQSRRTLVQQLARARKGPPSDGPLARILQLKALPQHFAGAERGVNRKATLAYLQDLTAAADALQIQQDSGQHELVPPSEDPRAKLQVLRLLRHYSLCLWRAGTDN